MATYRRFVRRPLTVEAMQWLGEPATSIFAAMDFLRVSKIDGAGGTLEAQHSINVVTDAGVVRCEPGDWLVRDGAGQCSVCKADAFESTYALA